LHPTNYGYLRDHTPLTKTSPIPSALNNNPWPRVRGRRHLPPWTGSPINKVSMLQNLASYKPQYEVKWVLNTSGPPSPSTATRQYLNSADAHYNDSDSSAYIGGRTPISSSAQLQNAKTWQYYVRLPRWSITHVPVQGEHPSLWDPTGTAVSPGYSSPTMPPPSSPRTVSGGGISSQLRPMHIGLARFSYAEPE